MMMMMMIIIIIINREWRDRGLFESIEQRACDQARAIRKNGWLSQLE